MCLSRLKSRSEHSHCWVKACVFSEPWFKQHTGFPLKTTHRNWKLVPRRKQAWGRSAWGPALHSWKCGCWKSQMSTAGFPKARSAGRSSAVPGEKAQTHVCCWPLGFLMGAGCYSCLQSSRDNFPEPKVSPMWLSKETSVQRERSQVFHCKLSVFLVFRLSNDFLRSSGVEGWQGSGEGREPFQWRSLAVGKAGMWCSFCTC